MTPSVLAGIVASVATTATMLIALIACRLHRMKRALHTANQKEESLPSREKANPEANLYRRSSLSLAKATRIFEVSNKEQQPAMDDGRSRISSNNQAQSNLFSSHRDRLWEPHSHHDVARTRLARFAPVYHATVRIGSLRGQKVSIDKSSSHPHSQVPAGEFQHVPPLQPIQPQKIVNGPCASGSSRIRTMAAKFVPQTPPPQKEDMSSMWSSMSSWNPFSEGYSAYQFQPQSEISDNLDLVKVWWRVFPGSVAMSNPSRPLLAGRISGEGLRRQEIATWSSPLTVESNRALSYIHLQC
jgi:hypothetical protein